MEAKKSRPKAARSRRTRRASHYFDFGLSLPVRYATPTTRSATAWGSGSGQCVTEDLCSPAALLKALYEPNHFLICALSIGLIIV
jgi:hypothetical protein